MKEYLLCASGHKHYTWEAMARCWHDNPKKGKSWDIIRNQEDLRLLKLRRGEKC